MHINSYLVAERVNLGNFAAGGAIGTAAATVDVCAAFGIAQTSAGQTLTLPNPTDAARNGRLAIVANTGTTAFTMHGVSISATQQGIFGWHNGSWRSMAAASPQDFWRDVTAAQALPDGTNDTTEAIAHDGSVKIGGSTVGTTITPLPAGQINNYEWLEASATKRTQVMRGNAPLSYYTERTMPVAVNRYVDIGSFNIANGAHSHRFAITVTDSSFSVAKQYVISAGFNATGTNWAVVQPVSNSGIYAGQDFELLAQVNSATVTYRLRRTAGTVAAVARITVESLGYWQETFTESVSTGSDATAWAALNGCPLPMTRAALLTLRTNNALSTGCHYLITDHVQGQLVAGTTILLHAVSTNELGDTAIINTTYDNEGWTGRYDIDAALVQELTDNRNNRVVGSAAVTAFDWGNTAYTECTVEHSTWTVTFGSAQTRSRVRVLDGSTLNTSGMTGGSMSSVVIDKASTVKLSGGNLTLSYVTVTGNATLTATGYVAGGAGVIRTTIENGASVTLGAGSGAVSIQQSRIGSNGLISHTGSGPFTFTNGTLADSAQIQHSGAGTFTFSGAFVFGISTAVTHSDAGNLISTGAMIGPYGRIMKNGTSTGSLTLNYSVIDCAAYVQQLGNGNISMTGVRIAGTSYIRTLAGSAVPTLVVNYCTLEDSSYISMSAAATAGNATIQYSNLNSNSFIDKSGTGVLSVLNTQLSSTGRIQHNGVRNLSVSGSFFSNVGRVVSNATSGSGVTDAILNCSLTDYGVVQFNATGAIANQVQYCALRGNTANITFGGTNTGTVVTRMTVDNGNVTFSNNTAAFPTIIDIGVRDQGILSVSGCSAAQDIRYSTVGSYARWNMTNRTVAAQNFGIDLSAQGNFNQTGIAGNALYVDVRHGSITQNGGTLQTASKSMGGTLTTGNFAHAGIQHHANVSKTLTAANTSRADYQGLAAQLV